MKVPRRLTTRIRSSEVSKIRWLIALTACRSSAAPDAGASASPASLEMDGSGRFRLAIAWLRHDNPTLALVEQRDFLTVECAWELVKFSLTACGAAHARLLPRPGDSI